MELSELIKLLQDDIAKNGDREAVCASDDCTYRIEQIKSTKQTCWICIN